MDNAMGIHERLDIAHWTHEFPLSRLRAEARDYVTRRRQELPDEYPDDNAVARHVKLMSPKWRIVVGPADLAVNEQLKEEAVAGGERPARRSPTDVVVRKRRQGPLFLALPRFPFARGLPELATRRLQPGVCQRRRQDLLCSWRSAIVLFPCSPTAAGPAAAGHTMPRGNGDAAETYY